MSDTYTKLFRSITASTIVSEPLATRWLWVTLLSQSDGEGCIWASVPGLARLANISLQDCETALQCFLNPDPYSRTQDNEGRRIEVIDGGWRLLNHAKYDALRSASERAEYKREWDRRNRPSGHQRGKGQSDSPTDSPNKSDTSPTKSDSPTASLTSHSSSKDQEPLSKPAVSTDLLGEQEPPADLSQRRARREATVTTDAIEAYNRILGKPNGLLTAVNPKVGKSKRQQQVRRSLQVASEICEDQFGDKRVTPAFWQAYFEACAEDPFHSGAGPYSGQHANWRPDFEFLTRPATVLKVFERATDAAA